MCSVVPCYIAFLARLCLADTGPHLPEAARGSLQGQSEEGRQQGPQARGHGPIPPSFTFSAFKMFSFLGLASSHPPSKNHGPVTTAVYQVPTVCQV